MPRSRISLCTPSCYGRICIYALARRCACARARSLIRSCTCEPADARRRGLGTVSAPTATTSRFEVRQIYAGLLNAREAPFADSAVVTELPTTFRLLTENTPITALPSLPLAPRFSDSSRAFSLLTYVLYLYVTYSFVTYF